MQQQLMQRSRRFVIIGVVISVVFSDGTPDTGSMTPALFCGVTTTPSVMSGL